MYQLELVFKDKKLIEVLNDWVPTEYLRCGLEKPYEIGSSRKDCLFLEFPRRGYNKS